MEAIKQKLLKKSLWVEIQDMSIFSSLMLLPIWPNDLLTTLLTGLFEKFINYSIFKIILRDASDGDVIILPQNDHDGHYYLLKEPENELELLDFMQAIKDGKAERHGTSAIGRFVSDFLNGFIRLFKENPILGSLIGEF